VIEAGAAQGIDVEVITKDPEKKGFHPTLRWPVERTFGWLMLHRRLVRDFETRPERSRAIIHWAMIDNMTRRLTGESTPNLARQYHRTRRTIRDLDQTPS
jgi:hypothetical protein